VLRLQVEVVADSLDEVLAGRHVLLLKVVSVGVAAPFLVVAAAQVPPSTHASSCARML
jgi:hypothetical protein